MTPSPLSWVSSFMMERAASSARVHERPDSAEPILSIRGERASGPISRTVGLYQMVLRRTLEHFFPDAQLEIMGDRSVIDWDGSSDETYYRLHDDPNGVGVEIEWLGSRLVFLPGNPAPLLSTERHLVSVIVAAIDLRFRGLFNQDLSHRLDRFQYQTEDLIVADYLDAVSPYRIPAALERFGWRLCQRMRTAESRPARSYWGPRTIRPLRPTRTLKEPPASTPG